MRSRGRGRGSRALENPGDSQDGGLEQERSRILVRIPLDTDSTIWDAPYEVVEGSVADFPVTSDILERLRRQIHARTSEISKILKISSRTWFRWLSAGAIPSHSPQKKCWALATLLIVRHRQIRSVRELLTLPAAQIQILVCYAALIDNYYKKR